MEPLHTIWTKLAAFADPAWLQQWLGDLAREQPLAVLGLLAVPVVLALVSRRPLAVLAVLLMVLFTNHLTKNPAAATEWTAPAIYVASLVIAVMQWVSAHRLKRLRAELSALRDDVDRMRQAEQRRFIADLKGSPSAPNGDHPGSNH
jgi:hypothetical protein